jgi:hypothetical protein
VTLDRIKVYKCKKWEDEQIVSDEALAAYNHLMSTFPEMVSEDYETHRDVCIEYSDEVAFEYMPAPDWIEKLERTDTPLMSLFGRIVQ